MKRAICAALAALLLTAAGFALAEPEFDFSSMSLEELYAARDAIDAQISRLAQAGGARVYEGGTYRVGQDIPEGDYLLQEYDDAVFAGVVVRAGEAADADLINYSVINRQVMIHLTSGTCVTISEARALSLEAVTVAGLENGTVAEGSYLVGLQIPAGSYTAKMMDKAPLSSYSVYDGILGTNAQLIKFEILHGDAALELSEGDYVELSGCELTPNVAP